MEKLQKLVRKNVWNLPEPDYSRWNNNGEMMLLDANENPFNTPFNRMTNPTMPRIREALAAMTGVKSDCIYLSSGIDALFDTLLQTFCDPQHDNIVSISPTRRIYKQRAKVYDIQVIDVPLTPSDYTCKAETLVKACNKDTKMVVLCSPNDPTGNHLPIDELMKTLGSLNIIVVVDQSFLGFDDAESVRTLIATYPNLVVFDAILALWAYAMPPMTMLYAQPDIVKVLRKVAPQNGFGERVEDEIIHILNDPFTCDNWITRIKTERNNMIAALRTLSLPLKVLPSATNFLLIQVENATAVYDYLIENGIRVANVSDLKGCENCLRITIGAKSENAKLIGALRTL